MKINSFANPPVLQDFFFPQNKNVRIIEHTITLIVFLRVLHFGYRHGIRGMIKSVLGLIVQRSDFLPPLKAVLENEIKKELEKIEHHMLGEGDDDAWTQVPAVGLSAKEIILKGEKLKINDSSNNLKQWGGIYHSNQDCELENLQKEMWGLFNSTNSLYPSVFQSIRKFEAELISMVIDMLNGKNKGVVGLLTSGGTESILIAIHSYKQLAKERNIEKPNIISCETAHPAVDKACHYFGIDLIKLKADKNQKLSPQLVKQAIDKNTIAVYTSAPTFPHGVIDPIEEISLITKKFKIGLHVDNCLGGFYLSYLQRNNLVKEKWDFNNCGVTTISCDIHKYGLSSKGVSVIVFNNSHLRKLSFVPVINSPSLYVTPTLQGARSGAIMASAWATMLFMGDSGYEKMALTLHDIHTKVKNEIRNIKGLELLCESDLAVIPITSAEFNIYSLASLLEKRGWNMFTSKDPPCMSLCIGLQHQNVIDEWIKDVKELTKELRLNPNIKIEGNASVYSAAQILPDSILKDVLCGYIDVKLSVKSKKI